MSTRIVCALGAETADLVKQYNDLYDEMLSAKVLFEQRIMTIVRQMAQRHHIDPAHFQLMLDIQYMAEGHLFLVANPIDDVGSFITSQRNGFETPKTVN